MKPDVIGNGNHSCCADIIGNGGFDWTSVGAHFLGGPLHLVDQKANLESKITGNPLLYSSFSGEILATPVKLAPTVSDLLLIEDVSNFNNKRRITIGTLPAATPAAHALGGAQHTTDSKANLESKITGTPVLLSSNAGEIAAYANKASPTTSDLLVIEDAAAANAKKKITIDSLTPKIGFFASRVGANLVLPSLAETLIDFDTDADDPGANFSTVTDTFTAPSAGRYVFSACATIVMPAAGFVELRLKKNATIVAHNAQDPSKVATVGLCVSAVLQLAANDTVRLYAFQNTALNATVNSALLTLNGTQTRRD